MSDTQTETDRQTDSNDPGDCSNAPRIPSKGDYVRTYGTLVGIEDVTQKEIVLDYIFEETEARLEGRINGRVVKTYSTFSNFYGQDTCVPEAIKEAKTQEAWLGESDMEFVVVKVTRQTRMRPSREAKENFYAREFREMRPREHGCRWNLPDEVEEDVWSSKSR